MKKSLSTLALCGAVITACTVEASNFKGLKYGARAYPHAGVVFEVAPQFGATRSAYWCAGSEYARRYLGAGWQTPIYVVRGLGLGEVSGRKDTVLFTLDPVASQGDPSAIRSNGFNVGRSKTVQGADSHCDPYLLNLL
ncbi:MAG: hypothetical protein HRU33_23730 [Rhodobacteraceae bacterium]|nr:hypothetical protein [Paracoccaceae bacterium]